MNGPIASVKRLEELGLDPKDYPACCEEEQRNIPNRGRVWVKRGCKNHYECKWKDNTDFMLKRSADDTTPRPRNVVVKHIIPRQNGPGDIVINSWCSCFQFLSNQKRRDGINGELAEVVGGEGDTVRLKRSKRNVAPDGVITYTPAVVEEVVPAFPDPTEVDDLFEDIEAGRDRLDNRQRTVDAEREKRMGKKRKDDDVEIRAGMKS